MTIGVKICGIRSVAALEAARAAGADFFGLVFFTRSPRALPLAEARELASLARTGPRTISSVALVVDADDSLIDQIAAEVRPDWLQLHGKETVERARAIRTRTGLKIIKAVSVSAAGNAERAADYLDAGAADLLLFDAKPPPGAVLPGGNGVPFDWRLLDPPQVRRPFMLSGGLTPENVTEAVRLTHAAIVDVSSGVESSPGDKDPGLIRRFVAAARR